MLISRSIRAGKLGCWHRWNLASAPTSALRMISQPCNYHSGSRITLFTERFGLFSRRAFSTEMGSASIEAGAAAPPLESAGGPFEDLLDQIAAMPMDSNRLLQISTVVTECAKNEEWVNLMKLGLFLLTSPGQFCHHSCLLTAAALSTSPHPQESMGYMLELASRGIEPNDSCLVKVFNRLVAKDDHISLAESILSLTKSRVLVYQDIMLYTFSLCLRKNAFQEAYLLLDVIDAQCGSSFIRSAYSELIYYAQDEALDRYSRLLQFGLHRYQSYAVRMMKLGRVQDAADAFQNTLRSNQKIKCVKEFKSLVLELIKDPKNQPICHGSWNEAEKMVWALIRSSGCSHAAFEEAMQFWASLVPEHNLAAPLEDRVDSSSAELCEIRAMCLRRKSEVLFDMSRSGVLPRPLSFKIAVEFDPALYESREKALKRMQQMNANGSFKSLSGLWAAVMLAVDMAPPAPLSLFAELFKENFSAAIEDTNRMLQKRGHRIFCPRVVFGKHGNVLRDKAGVEQHLYEIEKIEDGALKFAWAQMISELYLVAKTLPRPFETIVEVLGEHFQPLPTSSNLWLFRSEIKEKSIFTKGERPVHPRWFFERSLRTESNPLILAECFSGILKYYQTVGDMTSFFEVADYMVHNRYIDHTGLSYIKAQCLKKGREEMFHEVIVELAEGLCSSKKNRYGAELLGSFKSCGDSFSCEALQQRWVDTMSGGVCSYDLSLDESFACTLEFYLSKINVTNADKLPWPQRSEVIDNMVTILVAQKTCGFTSDWKVLAQLLPNVFLNQELGSNNTEYKNKMLKLARLMTCTEQFDRRISFREFFRHFSELGFVSGFEQIWDIDSEFCAIHAANTRSVHEIVQIKTSRSVAKHLEATIIVENAILKRGHMFAAQALQEHNLFELFLRAHLNVISTTSKTESAESTSIISAEMDRFENVISKLNEVGSIVNFSLFKTLLSVTAVDKLKPSCSVERIWTPFIYLEKLTERLELLPPSSVSLSREVSVHTAEIIGAVNSIHIKNLMKRPSGKSATMKSLYHPNHLSRKDREEMLFKLKSISDMLGWLISPAEVDLYQRFITFRSRLSNLRS